MNKSDHYLKDVKNKIEDFARFRGFHYDLCNKNALLHDFCIDMDRGLNGLSSSMPMIPSHLKPQKNIKSGKTVLALDAGGTNLRAALVSFDEHGEHTIKCLVKTAMPGTKGAMTAPDFFDSIAQLCVPLLQEYSQLEGIGFCFSYPMEMTEDGDGIPLAFSKEVDAKDVVGKAMGKGLKEALKKQKVKFPDKVILLNDTTATLLTGSVQMPVPVNGPVIGFILGTGLNTAYPESRIPKIDFENKDEPQIVVCESGSYQNRYTGMLDSEFDSTTQNPGAYCTEKMMSGAYLGPLSLHILKQAVRDNVIQFRKSGKLLAMPVLTTKDLNDFLYAPLSFSGALGSLFEKDEIDAIRSVTFLESIITERAGIFAAAMLAGTAAHIGAGKDPLSPLRIAVEGTTFLLHYFLRESIEAHLHTMLCERDMPFYTLASVEGASLLGAAVAALGD
ncbi:MAG: hexokinase [Spirochaetaceae bacterium]|jgi:hexokinase|nr:hexokinase [Spirochaetaceae bacterium]